VGRADKVEALLNEFEEDAETLRRDLCRAIYADLEETYEALTSEEAVMELAEANDYTFRINGEPE
jgi:metal-dependent HD superfamily phosphatase/phosphodiesterase